jgi:putative DNA-invertase from lambdoid prophage Rac
MPVAHLCDPGKVQVNSVVGVYIYFVTDCPMPRTFAYARVSTTDQETQNQVAEIGAASFKIEPHRIITETISGSVAIVLRPEFSRLLDKMEQGDVLIVTKLDRLGRDAIDVASTVAKLEALGICVHCLALGGVDLTSSAGKLTMGVINAVAQFERDLLIERTQSGLARAKAEGKLLGRPPALSSEEQKYVRVELADGRSISAIARKMKTSRQTIMRARDQALAI